MEPGILLGLRTRNDPVPPGETAFLLASTRMAIEDGYTPLKIQHFAPKKKGGRT